MWVSMDINSADSMFRSSNSSGDSLAPRFVDTADAVRGTKVACLRRCLARFRCVFLRDPVENYARSYRMPLLMECVYRVLPSAQSTLTSRPRGRLGRACACESVRVPVRMRSELRFLSLHVKYVRAITKVPSTSPSDYCSVLSWPNEYSGTNHRTGGY